MQELHFQLSIEGLAPKIAGVKGGEAVEEGREEGEEVLPVAGFEEDR